MQIKQRYWKELLTALEAPNAIFMLSVINSTSFKKINSDYF